MPPGPRARRSLSARWLAPRLEPEPGSYLLALELDTPARVRIGRLGTFELVAGCYLYAGSALGPGGVRARVLRHARRRKPRHWHVDALRAVARLTAVWVAYGGARREHAWAEACRALPGARVPVPGFGASDCRCPAHLVHMSQPLASPSLVAAPDAQRLHCFAARP